MTDTPTPQKRFVIGGASQGIGKATVEALLQKGHAVIGLALGQAIIDETMAEITDKGYTDIEMHDLNLMDLDRVKEFLSSHDGIQEGLDGLVCNAGFQALGHPMDLSLDDIDKTIQLNVKAPIVMMQATYEALKKRQGAIVYTSSMSAERYEKNFAVYGGSKGFMNHFIKHASCDMGFDGVRINTISPGAIQTPMMDRCVGDTQEAKDGLSNWANTIPMEQRLGKPEEVAEAIVFALEGPRYLHGGDIRVTGGVF